MRREHYGTLAGALLLLVGSTVIFGWLSKYPVWEIAFTGSTAMVFNTALCFVLAGFSLVSRGLGLAPAPRIRCISGYVIAVIATLALLENIFSIDLGVDWHSQHQWFHDNNPMPGRMAPNTAFALLIGGLALTLDNATGTFRVFRYIVPAAMLTTGVLGVIAYTLLLNLAYSWFVFPRMAIPTAIGVIFFSSGLMAEGLINRRANPRPNGDIRIYAFMGAAVTILLTIAMVSYGSINALIGRANWVEHTGQVRIAFEEITALDERTRSAWRRYLLVRDAKDGEELKSLAKSMSKKHAEILQLTRDNPEQQSRLKTIIGLTDHQLAMFEKGIALIEQGHIKDLKELAPHLPNVRSGQLQLDAVSTEFRAEENRLLAERRRESQLSSDAAVMVIIVGNALGFGILLYSFWVLKRQNEERNRLDRALKGVNEELNELYEKAPCGYHSINPDGLIIRMNDTELGWLGYERDEVIGKMHYSRMLTPDSMTKVRQRYRDFVKNGAVEDVEYEYVRKDGSIFPVSMNSLAVRDSEGKYILSRSATYNITKRKQAEQELFQLNAFLSSLIENIPNIIVVKDAKDLRYVRVNKAAEAFLGFTQQELAGKNVFDFLTKEKAEASAAADRAILEGRQMVNTPESVVRAPGKMPRTLHTVKIPILGEDGTMQYLLSIAEDITEQKQAEHEIRRLNSDLEKRATELEAANKELEGFAYSISHDLRAPLRAIDGYALMLQEDCMASLDQEGRRYLEQVRHHSQRMGSLIDDLLRFSRLGRQSMKKTTLNMRQLALDVLDEELGQYQGKTPHIKLGEMPVVEADPTLLRQVWVNLLSNAFKYSSKVETPEITINGNTADNEAVYSVSDNGAGFDMAYYDKLFGVFQRLHSMEEFDGTGVGLAIVQRVISRHGGRVWAKSSVNGGAVFYFSLPTGANHGDV